MVVRTLAILALLGSLATRTFGQTLATVDISAYPEAAVADGRSSLSVAVTIRDRNGNYVPDGTQVAFTTSLGQFADGVIGTSGGVARATLITGNIAGKARITAAVQGYATVAALTVDFVTDASQLRKTTTFLEATGPAYLAFAVDVQLVAATGANQGARVAYRDIEIKANDLQVDTRMMVVIAYRATITVGAESLEASELSYNLRAKTGIAVIQQNGIDRFVELTKGLAVEQTARQAGYDDFRFSELIDSTTVIVASSIIVDPGRQALFTNAKVYVGTNKLVSLRYYAVDLSRPGGLFNDQVVGVNQDGISLDLPYYVSLGPRQSSSLRLRAQHTGGRTYTTSRGTSLDWVTRYNDGQSYSGDFTVSDLASGKFGMTVRHSQKLSDTVDGYFLLDSPRHETVYGYSQISKRFSGFHASLGFSGNEGISRDIGSDRRADFTVDTDSKPIFGKLLYQSFGFTANYHTYTSSTFSNRQEALGPRYRLRTGGLRLGTTSIGAGLIVSKLWGRGAGDGVNIQGSVGSTTPIGTTSALSLTYDYYQDQFNANILGKHRVTGNFVGSLGSFGTSVYFTRSLDLKYQTLFADGALRLSKLWRVGFNYTWSDSLSSFSDHGFFIGYTMGFREIAIRWSALTRRFGIEVGVAGF